ncbi:MAG: hypothetical protein ACXIUQ_01630 [Cecembia sp.]
MNMLKNLGLLMVISLLMTSCILEDVEPEYDIIGAVGTISELTASTTSPSVGQTVSFRVVFYSEHENATRLDMNRVQGSTVTNLDSRSFSTWNKEDSYVETFQFVVPEGSEGSVITIQFELFTESNFSRTRSIALQVAGS